MENKKMRRSMVLMVMCVLLLAVQSTAFAAGGTEGIEASFQNFMDILAVIARVVGIALTLWGIWQFALAMREHDPSRRSSSIFEVLAGIIIIFSMDIVNAIVG